jgi:hypothetical protein
MLREELAFPFSGFGFEEPQAASCGAVFVGRTPARVGFGLPPNARQIISRVFDYFPPAGAE